jgi:hypothetical protein
MSHAADGGSHERGHARTLIASVLALALVATALLMLLQGSAGATGSGANLLANPGAEAGPGGTSGSSETPPPDWTVTGEFTAVQYEAAGGFPSDAVSKSIGGETNFFAGGDAESSTATQTVDVSASAGEIDAGKVTATLSADLGGYASQSDNMVITATALNAAGAALQTLTIGPVTEAERKGETTLLARTTSQLLDAGTRSIRVVMTATRVEGEFDDGYADNVSLTLGAGASAPAGSTTLPAGTTFVPGTHGVVAAPSNEVCRSRRDFTIHIIPSGGLVYSEVTVFVNGKRVNVTKGSRISAPVDLRGLPKGRYVVKIVVTTSTGKKIVGTRAYHTCVPKRKS